jgi:hypothetical protein
VHDSVATEDHRGETACDAREKKPGCVAAIVAGAGMLLLISLPAIAATGTNLWNARAWAGPPSQSIARAAPLPCNPAANGGNSHERS